MILINEITKPKRKLFRSIHWSTIIVMTLIITIIFFLFILTYKLPNKKFNKNKKKEHEILLKKPKK